MRMNPTQLVASFEAHSVAMFATLALTGALVAPVQAQTSYGNSPGPATSGAPAAQAPGAAPMSPAQAAPTAPPATTAVPPNRWTSAQITEAFRKTDADGDGKITRQEATMWSGLSRQFDAIDTNKDGSISSAEFEEALK